MIKQVLVFAAASTLAAKLAQHLGRRHQQRRAQDERRRHHEDVRRWEEEGGNLPVTPKTR